MEFILTRDSLKNTVLDGKPYLFAGLDINLEKIYRCLELPQVLCQMLQDGITWHIRSETTLERSILSPGGTYPWISMLMALGVMVIYPDGSTKSLPDYMKQRTHASGSPNGILIPSNLDSYRICYQAVRPRPAALPTVSVCTVFELEKDNILHASISVTGTWRNKLGLIQSVDLLRGKQLNEALIPEIVELVMSEIKPVSNFQASAEYRKAMAKVLTERAVQACVLQQESIR